MKLGVNLALPMEWETFRPFSDALNQMEPWWYGDWNNRRYLRAPTTLGRPLRSVLGPNMVEGFYDEGRGDGPALPLRGDVRLVRRDLGETSWEVGHENVWLESDEVGHLEKLRGLFLRGDHRWIFSSAFIEAVAPFPYLRLMDWCGPGSGLKSVDEIQRSGNSCRAIPLDYPSLGLHAEVGVRPEFVHEAASLAKRVHLSPPIQVCASPHELTRWVERFVPKDCEFTISPSNELWNADPRFPASALLRSQAIAAMPGIDPLIASFHLYLKLCLLMRSIVAPLGARVRVVCEWWNANRWPLVPGAALYQEARAMLRDIGTVSVAPYIGHGARTLDQLRTSMSQPLSDLAEWNDVASSLRCDLECYECGLELPDGVSLEHEPGYGDVIEQYLARMRSAGVKLAYWYVLAGARYGATRRLGETSATLTALQKAAASPTT